MGVKGLMKFIEKHAPGAIRKGSISGYFGRKVAIDASMQIYQFMVAVRHQGSSLVDSEGNPTSHLQGLMSRTTRFVENGLKPIYVFDGKPPEMKSGELEKRKERREEAEKAMMEAIEAGNEEEIEKFSRRTVRLGRKEVEECMKLLKLMGIPYVEAPCEAEAECAALCRAGLAWATATEDMDAIAHATPVLLRHLSYSKGNTDEVIEIDSNVVLQELELTREQFIDFCILSGCDYCDTIKKIGPESAYKLIQQYGCIEKIIQNIDTETHPIPEDFNYVGARDLFMNHEVTTDVDIKWTKPDRQGLVEFMVNEKGFSETRIENVCAKIEKAKSGGQQTRMDAFFSAKPVSNDKKKAALSKKPATKAKATKKK